MTSDRDRRRAGAGATAAGVLVTLGTLAVTGHHWASVACGWVVLVAGFAWLSDALRRVEAAQRSTDPRDPGPSPN